MRTASSWLIVAVMAFAATSAMAQGRSNERDRADDRGRDNSNVSNNNVGNNNVSNNNDRVDVQASINFTVDQRQAVSVYLGDQRKGGSNCPPGLAKKNNGCQPPGQAKRYQLGQPLPRDIGFQPVPDQISVRIGLPPVGYIYGMVDGDLVKLAVGTLLVIDAIDGL